MSTCIATVRPAADISAINMREGASTQTAVIGALPAGTSQIEILAVQEDIHGANIRGRKYQWFKLKLANDTIGWVREDLLEIQGDCSLFGYGVLPNPTRPANITRTDPSAPPSNTLDPAKQERIRKAAFNISAAFEGRGYNAYQTYDAGIISYGRFQFTLASGSLADVVDLYLSKANDSQAERLRSQYAGRIRAKDSSLRNDQNLKTLLLRLARDPKMQEAQDEYATKAYWNLAQQSSVVPRGVITALGQALIFDMSIHHGAWGTERDYLRVAEQAAGASPKSKLYENGLTETAFIGQVAKIRRDRLYVLANQWNMGGLKVRGDFWVLLVNAGDWDLQGGLGGQVTVKSGVNVQVRNP